MAGDVIYGPIKPGAVCSHVEGTSKNAAAGHFGIDRKTVAKGCPIFRVSGFWSILSEKNKDYTALTPKPEICRGL